MTKKQDTHARIVRTAAAAIRERGYAGASVAEIMEQAGLTHGGFYAHFADRDAMLAEAVDQGASESMQRLDKTADLDALVTQYLSDAHCAHPENGCTLAALGSETRRQAPAVREVTTRRTKELADAIGRHLPNWGTAAAHDEALAVMSALVGALVIARAVDDPALAKSVRRAAAAMIRKKI